MDWATGFGQGATWVGIPGAPGYGEQLAVRQAIAAVGEARPSVSKSYPDDNEAEVDATLTCSSGLPLEQNFTIAGDG